MGNFWLKVAKLKEERIPDSWIAVPASLPGQGDAVCYIVPGSRTARDYRDAASKGVPYRTHMGFS